MYLLDTNVVSELRKHERANPGVLRFFRELTERESPAFISVITLGELRRGVEMIRYRGDEVQARVMEEWLQTLVEEYGDNILDFGREEAQIWGRLRVSHHENALDKQIAASALIYGLTLVTRNVRDFTGTGIALHDPFDEGGSTIGLD